MCAHLCTSPRLEMGQGIGCALCVCPFSLLAPSLSLSFSLSLSSRLSRSLRPELQHVPLFLSQHFCLMRLRSPRTLRLSLSSHRPSPFPPPSSSPQSAPHENPRSGRRLQPRRRALAIPSAAPCEVRATPSPSPSSPPLTLALLQPPFPPPPSSTFNLRPRCPPSQRA